MNKPIHLLTGLALGATTMYLLDPFRGKRRRATLRDQFNHWVRETGQAVNVSLQDLAQRTQGVVAETRSSISPQFHHVGDQVLTHRVRSKLGRIVSHPHALKVHAHQGNVVLSGPILKNEHEPLISAISRVHGVASVEDQLAAHSREENLPSLQGGKYRPGQRIDLLQTHWAPATRLIMGLSGAVALNFAIRNRTLPGSILGTIGLLSLARSITNLEISEILGFHHRTGLHLHKTINVDAPIQEVFDYFSNPALFPKFIKRERIVERIPQSIISWKNSDESPSQITLTARLFETEPAHTKIELDYHQRVPFGSLGYLWTRTFGFDTKRKLERSISQIKQMIEQRGQRFSPTQAQELGSKVSKFKQTKTLGSLSKKRSG